MTSPDLNINAESAPLTSTISPPVILPANSSSIPALSTAVVLPNDAAIASLIRMLLKRSGLTQREAARRMGLSQQGVNQYANMKRTRPSIQWIARLAEVCGARFYIEFPKNPL